MNSKLMLRFLSIYNPYIINQFLRFLISKIFTIYNLLSTCSNKYQRKFCFWHSFNIFLLGPPSSPGEPKIVDFDNKSVTLRWDKPKNDGGRAITHYIIQKKDKFGGWFDALITDDQNCTATIDELEARVPGLSEGKWYQFRVIAVNKAGESDPSPETKPHLCRHKNCKFWFLL